MVQSPLTSAFVGFPPQEPADKLLGLIGPLSYDGSWWRPDLVMEDLDLPGGYTSEN